LRRFPGAAIAADQLYREADLAHRFFARTWPALPKKAQVLKIVDVFKRFGATAKDLFDPCQWLVSEAMTSSRTSRLFLKQCADIDIDRHKGSRGVCRRTVPMMRRCSASFPTASVVANVLDFQDELSMPSAFVAKGRGRGRNFAELADMLLAAKG